MSDNAPNDSKRKRRETKSRKDQHKKEKIDSRNKRFPGSKHVSAAENVQPSIDSKCHHAMPPALDIIFGRCDGDLTRAGEQALAWMIAPNKVEKFLCDVLEKKTLLVRRGSSGQGDYFSGLFSKSWIEELFSERKLHYNRDFSLTQYRDSVRTTLKPSLMKAAFSEDVWSLFDGEEKASIRILRPQEHSDPIWKIISSLESFMGSGGGANAYLTPGGSQGFAPHYDDIDAFILQLEGKKSWTVYQINPEWLVRDSEIDEMSDEQRECMNLFPQHPLMSSEDFTPEQVEKYLKPCVEIVLEAGDLLYIPRGMVHQAKADEDSLHVTISTGQRNTWADFIGEAIPPAVELACRSDAAHDCARLRELLPRDYMSFMGIVHSDRNDDPRRTQFHKEVDRLITTYVMKHLDYDLIADRMAAKFQHDRHRPVDVLGDTEKSSSKVRKDSQIALVAKGTATLTIEGDAAVLYHSCKNTRVYHQTDPRGLEFEQEDAYIIEPILMSDPNIPIAVKSLGHSFEDIRRVVGFLLDEDIVKLV